MGESVELCDSKEEKTFYGAVEISAAPNKS